MPEYFRRNHCLLAHVLPQEATAALEMMLPRRALALLLSLDLLAASDFVHADSSTFRVDPALTNAEFAVMQLGISKQRGRFERMRGTIILDAQRKAGSIDFVIDAASVNTGWNLRDAFLKSAHMLDAERFPTMRFHSTHLAFDDTRLIGVDGEITLRGVTRPVRFEVKRVQCGGIPDDNRENCGALVTGRISRRAFGMDFAYPLVGDDVELDFAVTAFRVRDEGETETP